MANKIISFGSVDQSFLNTDISAAQSIDPSLEVFIDICLESSPVAQVKDLPELAGKTASYKVEKSLNVKAIFNSLRNIFTWIPGERILLPEFGSRLRSLLYEGITPQTEEAIVAEIRQSVSEWEPRVQIVEVRNVSTINDTEDNTIHLEVVFSIPSLSDQQYSYSFYYNRIQ